MTTSGEHDTTRTGRERFLERARTLGCQIHTTTFPATTRTAADAAAAIGCELGQIVKSLVFIADGEPVVALVAGDRRVDEAHVAHTLGLRELRKADAAEARAATGYAIGGTPPFGHDRPLTVVADSALLDHEVVWAAAGGPHDVFSLTPRRLIDLAQARVVDVSA